MWDRWVVVTWFVWFLAGSAFEVWCNFNGSPKTPTLTDVVTHYFRGPLMFVMLVFFTWLYSHFLVNYFAQSKVLRFLLQ